MKSAASALFLLAVLLVFGINAHAFSLSLQGQGAGINLGTSQAVYASDSIGTAVLIANVGQPAPGGGKITELGVPSMMADGRILFGAEVTSPAKDPKVNRHEWNIFIGDPEAKADRRVSTLEIKSKPSWCNPAFVGDPYPVSDAAGDIAFMASLGRERDGLFLYSGGALSCLAESGTVTLEGDRIAVLSFGSPQMGDPGEIAFNAWLQPKSGEKHLQALLLATRTGVHELAVEGQLGPNRTEYMRPFGLPSAIASPRGTLVAFTAKTPSGAALFLYDGTGMVRALPTSTQTPLGPVSYLSPGRPGLMSDGTMAVLAGCARVPVIFRLTRGLLDLRITRGQLTPVGSLIDSLGDPVLTATGAMFVGATDSDGLEKLYELDNSDQFFEVGSPEMLYRIAEGGHHEHTIFTGTLTVNQHGDFGYLGGK